MDYTNLKNYIDQGLSFNSIAKLEGLSLSTILYWAKKHKLRSTHKSISNQSKEELSNAGRKLNKNLNQNKKPREWDWEAIQKDHDNGLNYKALYKKYNLHSVAISQAQEKGLFKTVSKEEIRRRMKNHPHPSRPHTKEAKIKMSNIRKKWLKENPDKKIWVNEKKSVPCELLKSRLKDAGIEFQEEYQPLLYKDRFFAIDIFIPQIRLGLEVNGNFHYENDGITLTAYHQNRHDLITSEGIELLEIKYYKVFSETFIEGLVKDILNRLALQL